MNKSDTIIKLMVTIVERDKGAKIVSLYKKENLHFDFICLGRGTANSEILDYLGLEATEKDIIISMIPNAKVNLVKEKVNEKFKLSTPGNGILFTLPLSSVSGQIPQILCKEEFMPKESETRTMEEKKSEYALILTILNRGFTDKVMDAAKKSGARGGTVWHARRVGMEDVENFLGFTIQPEKEVIAILTHKSSKKAIMQEINKEVGLRTECHGIILALPVDDIMGLALGEISELS